MSMTELEKEALENEARDRLVQMLIDVTPKEGMADHDFRNFIQAMVWCLYCQLRENLGARAAMMAVGEVLANAAHLDGQGCGVQVDMVQVPKNPNKRH